MKKQKVLFVITKSNWGGAQRYVFDLATSLKDAGFEVAVAAGGSGPLIEKLKAQHIPTYTMQSFQRDIHIGKELQSIRELWNIYNAFKPDTIHLNSSKAGTIGALVARLQGFRNIVFTAHGWPFLEKRNILWRTMAWFGSYVTGLMVRRVIVVSQNDLQNTRMPFVTKKCTVIHTAIAPISLTTRTEARNALLPPNIQERHKDDLWALSVAELNHNKNISTAIDAIATYNTMRSKKIFYVIIGGGELEANLIEHAARKNITEYVHFLGHVPEAARHLNAADIFILPSHKEGFPYALLEAGAASLPVIASNVGGIPELIEHRVTGMLIDPTNSETIVNALESITDTEGVLSALGQALAKKVDSEFALTKMVDETIRVYLESY